MTQLTGLLFTGCSSASSCQNCPMLKDRPMFPTGNGLFFSPSQLPVLQNPGSSQQLCLPDTNKLLEVNKTIKFGHLNQQILIPLKCVWLLAHCKLLIYRSAPEKRTSECKCRVFLWRALKTGLFWSMFHLKTWMMCRGGRYFLASSSISEQLFL